MDRDSLEPPESNNKLSSDLSPPNCKTVNLCYFIHLSLWKEDCYSSRWKLIHLFPLTAEHPLQNIHTILQYLAFCVRSLCTTQWIWSSSSTPQAVLCCPSNKQSKTHPCGLSERRTPVTQATWVSTSCTLLPILTSLLHLLSLLYWKFCSHSLRGGHGILFSVSRHAIFFPALKFPFWNTLGHSFGLTLGMHLWNQGTFALCALEV